MKENVEGFRNARVRHRVALDDGFISLGTSCDVIGLDGEDLLKDVGCAECLERPDLHFSEPLSTELSLTSERLLRDE